MAKSTPIWYQIPEWYGVQQQLDGTLLPVTSAYDARNMETGDGNLSVAKGYEKLVEVPVPGDGQLVKLIAVRGTTKKFYAATQEYIYAWNESSPSAWTQIYAFETALTVSQVDALQTRIADRDVIIVATGASQMVKIYTDTDTATEFGAGLYSYEGSVSSYDPNTTTVTLPSPGLDAEAKRRAIAYGITIAGYYYDVYEIPDDDPTKVVLTSVMLHTPTVGDEVTVRGGGSDEACAYTELYSNRLFAAGDPNAPYRLYWSAVPGDGRTIEDWLSVDGSYDASGGYVEVGDGSDDNIIGLTALSNQLIIWKRYSVWRLFGDRPSTYTLERVDNESDLMSNSGVIVKYDAPYLLMPNGIYTYNSVSVVPVDNGVKYLRRFFDAGPDVSNSRSAFWDNRLYMSCKVDPGNIYDDTVIMFDITRNSYMIRDGFQLADLTAIGSDIYLLTPDRYVCRFEQGTSYDGTPIAAYWLTQPTDFGRKMYRHQAMATYMHITGDDMKVTVYGDYLDHAKSVTPLTARAGYTTVRYQTDMQYFIQFKFENIDGGAFKLHGGVNIYVVSEEKP